MLSLLLTSCSVDNLTFRFDTNPNGYRVYPLDVKDPVMGSSSSDDTGGSSTDNADQNTSGQEVSE